MKWEDMVNNMSTETINLIKEWIKIGNHNIWISEAEDPSFSINPCDECKSWEEIIEKLNQGNWCNGQAFYYKNFCFINQVNGGDEWLVIRGNIAFESIS